jgi:hypothetical protein
LNVRPDVEVESRSRLQLLVAPALELLTLFAALDLAGLVGLDEVVEVRAL